MTSKYTVIESDSAALTDSLSFLRDLDQRHFPNPWSAESWDQVFLHNERFLILQKPIGFALFNKSDADSFAHLLKIVVDPAFRKKGEGQKLLLASIKALMERGVKTFFLEVEESNADALNLYEKLGFKIVHQKKHFYSNGATALIMTKSV